MARGFWLGLAALVVAAGLLLAPVATAPATRILGNFQSEAATHAPALAAALEGLTRHGPFLLAEHPLHPEEVTGAMYEPITTLVMWPFFALAGGGARGFALAWNVWHLVVLVGASLGAWIWARAWLGEEKDPGGWGAGLAMALAAASIFVHLSPAVGRTEAQNYPLYALHGGLLFRAVRRGGRAWIGAILSVVPVVWSGGYATVFFAVAEPLVALWALSIAPNRRRAALGLVGVALGAVAAAAPLLWALQAHPYVGTETTRFETPSVALAVLVGWTENLLRELPGYEIAPFAGFVTLAAAGLAVTRSRAVLWPLAIGLFLYWVAAGPAPLVAGKATWGPAAAFAALPGPFEVVRGWSRIVAFVVPVFAVAAAALPGGRAWLAGLVAVLALGETSRHRVDKAWTLEEPASLVALRAAGQVPIPLPLDGIARVRRWLEPPDRPDVWKVMPDHVLFRYFQDALPNEPELFRNPGGGPAGEYDPCTLLADAVALRQLGFTSLHLRQEYLPHDGKGIANRALKAVFGAPREEGLWMIPDVVGPECRGEGPAPEAITLGGPKNPDSAGPRTPEERERIRAERRAERERVRAERLRQQQQRGQ